jgi:DNA-binding IclR family transcriptional regulator
MIANDLRMSSSTVLRFLTALVKCGYVDQEPNSLRYFMTIKIKTLGARIDVEEVLRDIAHPLMHQLAYAFNETICLAVEREYKVVYIDIVQGPNNLVRTPIRIGNSSFMHCTGIGKLLLTNYSNEQLENFVNTMGLKRYTDNTITNISDLRSELNKVKMQGYAFDNEECDYSAKCVAMPIYNYTGHVVAAISVSGTNLHFTDNTLHKNLPLLKDIVESISLKLGYNPS